MTDNGITLGEYLAKRRKQLRLTQQEVSERLRERGVDRATQTVAHWENNRQGVPTEIIPHLAVVLEEQSPIKLYELAGILKNLPGAQIVKLLDGIPPDDVERIQRMIEAYLKDSK